MSFIGGGSSAAPSTPSTQTQFLREAPGIEERKIIQFSRILRICMYTGKTMLDLFDMNAFMKESLREKRMLEERTERFGFDVDKKDLEIQEENIRLKAESKKRHSAMLADMADKDIAAKEIEDANIRPR